MSELARLDGWVSAAVASFRAQLAEHARDPLRGLVVSDADVDEILADRRPALAEPSRLELLARVFGLTDFERDALLVCLAPDIDARYERLFGYLQDDVARRRPTVGLVLRLLAPPDLVEARHALGPGGQLQRRGLLRPSIASADDLPLLSRPLCVDERVVEYAIGSDRPDPRVLGFAELMQPAPDRLDLSSPFARWLGEAHLQARHQTVYVHAPHGADSRRALDVAAQMPVLMVHARRLVEQPTPEEGVARAAREALLQGAVLAVDETECLSGDRQEDHAGVRAALVEGLSETCGPVVLIGETAWDPSDWPRLAPVLLELAALGPSQRRDVWHRHLNGTLPSEVLDELAARYRFGDETIGAVVVAARGTSEFRGELDVTVEDVDASARAFAVPPLHGLAQPIEVRYSWEDIVLPEDALTQLHELCARALHRQRVLDDRGFGRKLARRSGVSALFAGQPGTGKTLAAEIVAGSLGLPLYRIDLSSTVSKYIGETEKNMERIFRAAEQGDAILLFDEADALFGRRSEVRDAHDRYANVEVAYLLQRLEAYDGVTILTTNLRGNIDDAFLRRLDCVLEFPMPEEPERLRIWHRALPAQVPLADDVDAGLAFLARKFRLSGGHIRNIALLAAFLAAADSAGQVEMRHLVRATRREYQKLGKLVADGDFERYHPLLSTGADLTRA